MSTKQDKSTILIVLLEELMELIYEKWSAQELRVLHVIKLLGLPLPPMKDSLMQELFTCHKTTKKKMIKYMKLWFETPDKRQH